MDTSWVVGSVLMLLLYLTVPFVEANQNTQPVPGSLACPRENRIVTTAYYVNATQNEIQRCNSTRVSCADFMNNSACVDVGLGTGISTYAPAINASDLLNVYQKGEFCPGDNSSCVGRLKTRVYLSLQCLDGDIFDPCETFAHDSTTKITLKSFRNSSAPSNQDGGCNCSVASLDNSPLTFDLSLISTVENGLNVNFYQEGENSYSSTKFGCHFFGISLSPEKAWKFLAFFAAGQSSNLEKEKEIRSLQILTIKADKEFSVRCGNMTAWSGELDKLDRWPLILTLIGIAIILIVSFTIVYIRSRRQKERNQQWLERQWIARSRREQDDVTMTSPDRKESLDDATHYAVSQPSCSDTTTGHLSPTACDAAARLPPTSSSAGAYDVTSVVTSEQSGAPEPPENHYQEPNTPIPNEYKSLGEVKAAKPLTEPTGSDVVYSHAQPEVEYHSLNRLPQKQKVVDNVYSKLSLSQTE